MIERCRDVLEWRKARFVLILRCKAHDHESGEPLRDIPGPPISFFDSMIHGTPVRGLRLERRPFLRISTLQGYVATARF